MAPHQQLPDLPEGVVLGPVLPLAQEGKEPGLLQGIHRVGAGGAVGADAEVYPLPPLPDLPPAHPQLQVGFGADGDVGVLA